MNEDLPQFAALYILRSDLNLALTAYAKKNPKYYPGVQVTPPQGVNSGNASEDANVEAYRGVQFCDTDGLDASSDGPSGVSHGVAGPDTKLWLPRDPIRFAFLDADPRYKVSVATPYRRNRVRDIFLYYQTKDNLIITEDLHPMPTSPNIRISFGVTPKSRSWSFLGKASQKPEDSTNDGIPERGGLPRTSMMFLDGERSRSPQPIPPSRISCGLYHL